VRPRSCCWGARGIKTGAAGVLVRRHVPGRPIQRALIVLVPTASTPIAEPGGPFSRGETCGCEDYFRSAPEASFHEDIVNVHFGRALA